MKKMSYLQDSHKLKFLTKKYLLKWDHVLFKNHKINYIGQNLSKTGYILIKIGHISSNVIKYLLKLGNQKNHPINGES